MRVALVHDWLTGMRGGERVLEILCELHPEADLYTLFHVPGSVSPIIENRRIRESFLSKLPRVASYYRRLLPLFPFTIERFDLRGYDLVLSSSHCVAKGVRPAPGSRHVSYLFSPMRYLWDRYDDYFGPTRAGLPTRAAMALLRNPLQHWDRHSADRVDTFVTTSAFVAARIRRYYGREAEVLPAPVDTEVFRPSGESVSDEWLVVSAFVPYKRIEVAIRAANLCDVPLAVVGSGPEESALRSVAGSHTRFLGWVPDDELAHLYSRCRGFLFPGVEDFGITPLEAMGCGRPVIAYGVGGARETVRGRTWEGDPGGTLEAPTGLFVSEQTPEAFAEAIRALEENPDWIDPADCRRRAEEFGCDVFRRRIRESLPRWMAGG
jgi:glycosyltransferase involved in cell wall biosynthesis